MSKVLKIVAVVASVAAAAVTLGASLGISAALLSAVSLGAGIGASLLAPRPKGAGNSRENIDRLRANVDPRTPRKTAVGVTALATDIRDEEFTGDQEYFHRFIVTASHKINAHSEIWFDDKLAWTAASGVQGEFVGYLEVATREEGSAANAINISARMGSTRRYTGLAYVHLRYKLTGNSKKTDSPFAQSITTRITIRGEGAALYDPRSDSTVAGGSGSHRPDDQSTWLWDEDAARNPALQLLFYLLGYRITNPDTSEELLAVGKGIPAARIDLESFAVAANICDELVATEDSGTEPRYRTDGVWSEGDSPTTVLDMLKASMNADLDDVNGKLRLTIFHNDLAVPDAAFTDDDVLGAFEWEDSPPLDQTTNIIRGVFTDPSDESLYQPIDYPQVESASPDGIDRIGTVNFPMVQSADQAQRLAALRLRRQQFGAGTFRAEFQATAWAVQKNSIVSLTFAARGWVNKLFRVAEMDLREDGRVPMLLREEAAEIYDQPALQAPVDAIATTPFNFALTPYYQALITGEQNLISTSSQSLDYVVSATDTQIDTNLHTRKYTDRSVTVDAASITFEDDGTTAIAAETRYYLYYDDGDRLGGAVAIKATQDFDTAQNDAANPDRHFAGFITTDVSGGGGTSGGGSLPPGSGGADPNTEPL